MPAVEKTVEKDETNVTTQPVISTWRTSSFWIGLLVGFAAVLVLGVIFHGIRRNRQEFIGGPGPVTTQMGFGKRFDTKGEMGFSTRKIDGNQNELVGVVTNVDGDKFTIAGDGATNTVQTNDKTVYKNGDKVAVNDSVRVLGTINNGTFTATTVVINQ